MLTDPRPDLDDDSALWIRLLALVDQFCPELSDPLQAMRQGGTRLRRLASGNYGLRPEVRRGCWANETTYKTTADKHLKPHRDMLASLLRHFTQLLMEESTGVGLHRQARRVSAILATRGVCPIYSSVLNEKIYLARSSQAAAGAPQGAVVYTMEELRHLVADPPDAAFLRQLHAAKKILQGTVTVS